MNVDDCWEAVKQRSREADGSFVYAVKTTGVYCRPSCPSRAAKFENVRFFETPDEAEEQGYRACLRCSPKGLSSDQEMAAIVAQACRLIEESEEGLKLEELAESVGVSPHHFHRQFKKFTGLTPKAWSEAARARKLRDKLKPGGMSVTEALHEAGYASSSRLYEKSDEILGMTPSTFKNSGAEAEIRFAVGQCELGAILVAQSAKGICAISMGDDPEALMLDLQQRFSKAKLVAGDAEFELLVARVVGFIEAPQIGFELPLDIRGTAFQQRVWKALQRIPVGETVSYSQLATMIDAPSAVRAVAGACAANKIAVAIPCHRVVRNDGAISGYRWGVERKRALLEKEGATSVVD